MDRHTPFTPQPADTAGHTSLIAGEGSGDTAAPLSDRAAGAVSPGSISGGTGSVAAPGSSSSGAGSQAAPGSSTSGGTATADAALPAKPSGGTDNSAPGSPSGGKPAGRRSKKQKSRHPGSSQSLAPVSTASWFVTLMCMNIPVIGWIYLIILAFSRSAGAKKGFAKAYLLYKFLFLIITLAILTVALHYGLELLDKVLAYMEML